MIENTNRSRAPHAFDVVCLQAMLNLNGQADDDPMLLVDREGDG